MASSPVCRKGPTTQVHHVCMENTIDLNKVSVKNTTTTMCESTSKQEFNIFITMPNSGSITVRVGNNWTVGDMKQFLHDSEGVKASQARLVYHDKELVCNTMPLPVTALDTLHCLFKLCGGGKAKSKGGKSFKKGKKIDMKSELIFKEDGQEYAQVLKLLGSSRLSVVCADGRERLCTIRGKLVRRAWVNVGTIVLVSLREFEDGKCDMIHRYSDEEARNLRAYKELPHNMKLASEVDTQDDVGDNIEFDFDCDGEINIDEI